MRTNQFRYWVAAGCISIIVIGLIGCDQPDEPESIVDITVLSVDPHRIGVSAGRRTLADSSVNLAGHKSHEVEGLGVMNTSYVEVGNKRLEISYVFQDELMLLKSDVNFTVKLEGGEGRYVYGPGCYIINTGQSPLELWGGGATETNGLSWHVLVEENRDSHLLN